MSFQTLEATINETTVAAADTELDDLAAAAADLVASVSAMRMICKGTWVATDGATSKTFGLDCDLFDDSLAKILLLQAQYTAAITAIEGASTYTTVTSVKFRVKFITTE